MLDSANDIGRAKELADEAKDLDPRQNQARLRALIAWRESGAESALQYLENETEIESLNLKAALLLQLGRVQDAIAALTPQGASNAGI